MVKILLVCHGNICRSPMAEFVMKEMVKEAGLSAQFKIASAATSREELGNPVYPPARKVLNWHHISCKGKFARQMTRQDYDEYDFIIGMDDWNLRNLRYMTNDDPERKISLLMDYTDHPRSVADPWYTGDYETTWDDVNGCRGLLAYLNKNK